MALNCIQCGDAQQDAQQDEIPVHMPALWRKGSLKLAFVPERLRERRSEWAIHPESHPIQTSP